MQAESHNEVVLSDHYAYYRHTGRPSYNY